MTAGDGTYSVLTSVAPATTAGPKVIPTVITDALARTGSAPIQLTVQSNSTAPSGVGAANPSTVPPGSGTLLTVSVTPGANPPSTGLTVIGDLTAIGQTNAQLFFDDGTNGDVTAGDNVFSVAATVAPTTPVGGKSLPATITDDQSRTGTTTISLIVGDVVPPVVISQVYGGGGEAGAPFRNDFVELFNRGASPADLSTWSLQYASATGTTWDVTPLSGILQPGRYYLVQLASSGSVGAGLPAPNATGTTDVAFAAGKLVTTASPTYCDAMTTHAGSGRPTDRTTIAFGVRLNQVTVCSTTKRNVTTLTATTNGFAAKSRKPSCTPPHRGRPPPPGAAGTPRTDEETACSARSRTRSRCASRPTTRSRPADEVGRHLGHRAPLGSSSAFTDSLAAFSL